MTTVTPDTDLQANQQGVTLKATIPFAIIAVIAVICRFISRKIQSSRYEFDDWMAVVGLIGALGCFILSMEMVHLGSGKHLATIPLANGPKYLKVIRYTTPKSHYSYNTFTIVPLRIRNRTRLYNRVNQIIDTFFLPSRHYIVSFSLVMAYK